MLLVLFYSKWESFIWTSEKNNYIYILFLIFFLTSHRPPSHSHCHHRHYKICSLLQVTDFNAAIMMPDTIHISQFFEHKPFVRASKNLARILVQIPSMNYNIKIKSKTFIKNQPTVATYFASVCPNQITGNLKLYYYIRL